MPVQTRLSSFTMFPNHGLFNKLTCPERDRCPRPNCIFSHSGDIPPPRPLVRLPVSVVHSASQHPSQTASGSTPPRIQKPKNTLIPTKRPAISSPTSAPPKSLEPPRKFQKVGSLQRPSAIPSSSRTEVRSFYFCHSLNPLTIL